MSALESKSNAKRSALWRRLKASWATLTEKTEELKSNLHVAEGYPGFAHGEVAHFDRFAACLPFDAIDEEGLAILSGLKPEAPEGLGFVIELIPQTGANDVLQNELIGLTANCPVGTVLTITTYASPMVEGLLEWMDPTPEDLGAMMADVPVKAVSQQTARMLLGVNAGLKGHLLRLANPKPGQEGESDLSLGAPLSLVAHLHCADH
ncbi:MAG: TraC family protein [Sutterella wadsworthensis]|jgi:hypothetical protein|nr:TraC family protein [Sutterella wadsworthensis]